MTATLKAKELTATMTIMVMNLRMMTAGQEVAARIKLKLCFFCTLFQFIFMIIMLVKCVHALAVYGLLYFTLYISRV